MTEQEYISQLTSEGYDPVYIWDAVSHEEDTLHSHDFDTKLVVLQGDIFIEVEQRQVLLKPFDSIEILRNIVHSATVGAEGCRYIVAERH